MVLTQLQVLSCLQWMGHWKAQMWMLECAFDGGCVYVRVCVLTVPSESISTV